MTFKHHALITSQRLLRRMGLWLDRYERQATARRQKLLLHHEVDCVIDVGAHHGEYAHELRGAGYLGRIVGFEPGPAAYETVLRASRHDPLWTVKPWAIGSERGRARLNIAANEVSSSLLQLGPAHLRAAPSSKTIDEIEVEVRRLDDALAGESGSSLLLKADVQGAELMVLEGARETLKRTSLVELELSFVELYLGQPTLIRILQEMEALGFVLTYPIPGFTDPGSGRCLQMNGIFSRL